MSEPLQVRPRIPYWLTHWAPAAVWLGVMLYFSSVPDPYAVLGPVRLLRSDDAVYHTAGFVVLGVLVTRVAALVAPPLTGGLAWRVILLCIGYGILDEVHQIPIPGRTFNVMDILCDASGAVVGVVLAVLVGRLIAGRRRDTS